LTKFTVGMNNNPIANLPLWIKC